MMGKTCVMQIKEKLTACVCGVVGLSVGFRVDNKLRREADFEDPMIKFWKENKLLTAVVFFGMFWVFLYFK